MENKYYTPEIEDLCVGYECEVQTNYGYEAFNNGEEDWRKIKIRYLDDKNVYSNELTQLIHDVDDGWLPIRTQYLTKEQIVNEGWEYNEKFNVFSKAKDEESGYRLHMDEKTIMIADTGDCIYKGCRLSINEFRKIIKYLEIC